jgi:hypothetical protein
MPSRPRRAALIAKLAELAAEEIGATASPIDYLCAQHAHGALFSELAEFLAGEMGQPVSRTFLSMTAHQLAPDAKERIASARREGALSLGERAVEIADNSEPTSGAAARARNSMSARFWLAERANPALAGKGATIEINAGQLMLAALQAPPPAPPAELRTMQATARIASHCEAVEG